MRRNPEMVTVTLTCYKVGWGWVGSLEEEGTRKNARRVIESIKIHCKTNGAGRDEGAR